MQLRPLLPNNFDLVRLLAATQVMVYHLLYYGAHWRGGLVLDVLALFPGVPFFFFCSGFLISESWENSPNLASYVRNRALRIYPAYVAALVLCVAGILLFYHGLDMHANGFRFLGWIVLELAMIPWFVPHFLHGYGFGTPNGSLWTIPVEVFFYAAVPVFYRLFRVFGRPNTILVSVIILSVTAGNLLQPYDNRSHLMHLLNLSPLNTIGVFCVGMLAHRHRDIAVPFAVKRIWLFALAYVVLQVLAHYFRLPPILNGHSRFMGFANLAALSGLVLAVAFSARETAARVLRRQDVSYGIYLTHFPIADMVVANGIAGLPVALLTIPLTLCAAAVSWFAIEKPMLRLKRARVYSHG